jgi:predicted RNase H-like HicB family nuclease
MSSYQVNAEWDGEAKVWVASSDDVPGLATGADTLEALIEKLKIVIPELLVENGLLPPGTDNVPFAGTCRFGCWVA